MSSVYVRYVLPALVVAGCAVVILLGRRWRGLKEAASDHSRRIVESAPVPAPTDPSSEEAWHRLHSEELEHWIGSHEDLLDLASRDDFKAAPDAANRAGEAGDDRLDTAVAAHPNPLRRAELSALRAAARATLSALADGDYRRARDHHLVYCDYRDLWRRNSPAGAGPGES